MLFNNSGLLEFDTVRLVESGMKLAVPRWLMELLRWKHHDPLEQWEPLTDNTLSHPRRWIL